MNSNLPAGGQARNAKPACRQAGVKRETRHSVLKLFTGLVRAERMV